MKDVSENQTEDSIHCETTTILKDLIETGGENIANHSVKIIGSVSKVLPP